MTVLRVSNFDGMVPRTEPHALAETQAQLAANTKLYRQELQSFRGPTTAASSVPVNTKTIYKLYDYAGNFQWKTWTTDVDVATSPLTDTGDIRFYYTGDGTPKKSTYAYAVSGSIGPPTTKWEMGVPGPVSAPTLNATTPGTGTEQTRAYVYTFVSTFGTIKEESAPSPATMITVKPIGSTTTVSLFDSAPVGLYNVTHIRIYRSVTGAASSSYLFVEEIPIGTSSYADSKTVQQLGAALETIGWRPPPADMQGIVNMPGGVLAGFTGNIICFSQPFFAHAWPTAYQLTVPWKIVAIGVVGSSLVVATERYPFIISGGTPGAMSQERVPILEPCVSKRSMVSGEDGVLYASPNGMVTIGSDGRGVTTRPLYHREEWSALLPSQLMGAMLDGRYIGVFAAGPQYNTALIMDKADVPALCAVSMITPTCVHVDSKNGSLFYFNSTSNSIMEMDAHASDLLTYTWTSKKWYMPFDTSWSACQVNADHGAGTLTIKGYASGVEVFSISPTSDAPFRLPAFKTRDFHFTLTGTRDVHSVAVATSVVELTS